MNGHSAAASTPGLELGRLGAWFAATVPGAGPTLTAALVAGGRSNLTYVVSDGVHEWIVRRPPLGHVLATAHDMAREYRVITALRGTPVPVPATVGLCLDPAVVGAPFVVMERVAGTPYRRADQLAALGADRTRTISTRLVETLAVLHRVDPTAVGLGDLGRAQGYLGRQVSRWKTQLDASRHRDLPAADDLYARLAADVPQESATGIVHGDYRLDNLLVDGDDKVTAVLDWEMATLGDPLADLALMVVYGRLGAVVGPVSRGASPGSRGGDDVVTSVANAPGYLGEAEIVDRYVADSGRDLAGFGFHLGLAAFKIAAILEGIHYRYLTGQTVGEGFAQKGEAVPPLLAIGLEALDEDW